MTPAKRRPDTPASEGPTRSAPAPEVPIVANPPPVPLPPTPGGVRPPDVPTAPPDAPVPDVLVIAPVPPAETKDNTQEAATGHAGGDSAPPTETEQAAPADRAPKQSPGRSRARHPARVWPD